MVHNLISFTFHTDPHLTSWILTFLFAVFLKQGTTDILNKTVLSPAYCKGLGFLFPSLPIKVESLRNGRVRQVTNKDDTAGSSKEHSLNIKWIKQALARLKTLSNRKNDPLYNPATKSNVNPQMSKFKTWSYFLWRSNAKLQFQFCCKKFIHNFKCPLWRQISHFFFTIYNEILVSFFKRFTS